MQILTLFSFLFIILLLTSMMAKVKPWRRLEKPGKTLKALPMGVWARVQLHRSALVAIGFAIIFGLSAGWMEAGIAFILTAFSIAVLLLPMQYTFTTEGIAIGEVTFRKWDEFSGIKINGRRIELRHPGRFGHLTLFIKAKDVESVFKKVKLAH